MGSTDRRAHVFRVYAEDVEPSTRIGRVSDVTGNLAVIGPGDNLPLIVPVNYPVAPGMRFTTDIGGHAELQFGNLAARLDAHTEVKVIALDETVVGIRLTYGKLSVGIRALTDEERVAISTDDAQIMLAEPGTYRVEVATEITAQGAQIAPSAITHVAVLSGAADVHSPHDTDHVFAGEALDIDGPHAAIRYGIALASAVDTWRIGRDQAAASPVTNRYLPADVIGGEDLENTGVWEETVEYGAVWYPRVVPAGWAPYRHGRWIWVAPWGWTWVDHQPWGFAPFHYGRWISVGSRWGWRPGNLRVRRTYAPALVSFPGNYRPSRYWRPERWSPLRPGQQYRPSYGRATVNAYFRHYRRGLDNLRDARRGRKQWGVKDRTRIGSGFVNRGDRNARNFGKWQAA